MITRFRVRNFKALHDVTLDLTPVHVLIGPNNSGKTSVLEAIQALCRSVDFPLDQAFAGQWKGRELVWRADATGEITLEVSADDGEGKFDYQLKAQFPALVNSRNIGSAGEIFSTGAEVDLGKQVGKNGLSYVLARMRNQNGGTAEQLAAAARVHAALSGVHIYRWDPRLLALPAAPDSSRRFRMDPSGFGLALCMDDILGYDRQTFGDLERRFRDIFPEIESIKLIPEPAYKAPQDHTKSTPVLQLSEGKGIYFQMKNMPELVPATQASDGVLLVLAYLTILSLPQPPKVILLDEPENGIHPKRLRDVISILRDLVGQRRQSQIVLTTHSPYALDMFKPEEVTVCRQINGETKVARLSESKSVHDQIDIFSLGEIWTAEGDDKIAVPNSLAGVKAP
jgi:predicted ATPase